MLPPNLPSVDMLTPMTPSAALTSPPPKKKSALATPLPKLWEPPLPPPPTSQAGTQSSPSLPMEPPSPETNLLMLCDASLLQLRELSARWSPRTLATTSSVKPPGKPATMSRSPKPKLIGFSTLSHSVQPVPHLDLSQLNCFLGLQRSWQEVVQSWRSQQLERAQEVQATCRRRVVESQRSLATRAKKTCSQLSTPSFN
jgi:hypothetical protein